MFPLQNLLFYDNYPLPGAIRSELNRIPIYRRYQAFLAKMLTEDRPVVAITSESRCYGSRRIIRESGYTRER